MTDETDIRASTPPGRASQTSPTAGAREAASELRHRADEVREAARSTLHDAKAAAEERTEAAKDQAAGEIARTARGLEAAADELADAPLQQELLREAAGGLQQIARAVQGKSLGALVEDLADFGRRNPVAYLGGAALAGFALARFARASAPSDAGGDADYRGTGGSTGYGASSSAEYRGASAYPSAAEPGTSPQAASGAATSPQWAADLAGDKRDG